MTQRKEVLTAVNEKEYSLREYLWDLYQIADPVILGLFQKHLSLKEQVNLGWHATAVSSRKVIVVLEHPERIREVVILGIHGGKLTFKVGPEAT